MRSGCIDALSLPLFLTQPFPHTIQGCQHVDISAFCILLPGKVVALILGLMVHRREATFEGIDWSCSSTPVINRRLHRENSSDKKSSHTTVNTIAINFSRVKVWKLTTNGYGTVVRGLLNETNGSCNRMCFLKTGFLCRVLTASWHHRHTLSQ